jgi:mRNA interferase ChpB
LKRGEIWLVDLEPTKGKEQQGKRPVLIVTPAAFNAKFAPLVCPITGGGNVARFAGFAVSLTGTGLKTDGVILCHQLRVVDVKARGGKKLEAAPEYIVEQVVDALADLLAPEAR